MAKWGASGLGGGVRRVDMNKWSNSEKHTPFNRSHSLQCQMENSHTLTGDKGHQPGVRWRHVEKSFHSDKGSIFHGQSYNDEKLVQENTSLASQGQINIRYYKASPKMPKSVQMDNCSASWGQLQPVKILFQTSTYMWFFLQVSFLKKEMSQEFLA